MRIEHAAYQVDDPGLMANWYCKNLGFQVKRSADSPVPVRFMADESGTVMLEIYNNPQVIAPDYAAMDPLVLHLAFVCDDLPAAVKRLTDAGASVVSDVEISPGGDELAMLRDPWGLAIQMVKRACPMV